jgi:S1-C subfamily serine protease
MKRFIILALLLIGNTTLFAQVHLPVFSENCIVTIENAELDSLGKYHFMPHGTGFLVMDDSTNTVFLISNRHVFGNRDSIIIRVNVNNKSGGIIGERYICYLIKNGKRQIMVHPDSTIDLGILYVPFINENIYPVETSRFKLLKDVRLGDPVLFLGFPLAMAAIGDMNYPLVRQGIVSYISINNIFDPTTKKCLLASDHILIDGNIMPGNSGSPVFSVSSLTLMEKASFIGVISSHLYEDRANVYANALGIKQDYDYKLGICIPADRVKELIEYYKKYLTQQGLLIPVK